MGQRWPRWCTTALLQVRIQRLRQSDQDDRRGRTGVVVHRGFARPNAQSHSRTDAGNAIHTWSWDPTYAKGSLAGRSSPGFSESLTYTASAGLLSSSTTTINFAGISAKTVAFNYNYDAANRLVSIASPSVLLTISGSSTTATGAYAS